MTESSSRAIQSEAANAIDDFKKLIDKHPGLRYLDVIMADNCARIRGKRIPIAQAGKVYASGIQLPESTYLLSVDGSSSDPGNRGFTDGDPDGTLFPIPRRTHLAPWHAIPTAQVLTRLCTDNGAPCITDPRNIAEMVADTFNSLGFSAKIAFELEFYLIDPNTLPGEAPRPAKSRSKISDLDQIQVYSLSDLDDRYEFIDSVHKACEVQEIPASIITSEFAPSQYEINLNHVDDPLTAADHCILLRRVVEESAKKHDMRATFMPKPFLDQSGSGMHVHMSMFDDMQNNIFAGEDKTGSEMLRFAIGGLLETIPDMLAIFAPNINAFRRFEPDMYVPVNPAWGFNNRSLAVRIPAGDNSARRFEHRVASADANPYLVLAAILAGVHHGIENRIEPRKPSDLVNAGSRIDPSWPFSWIDALDRFNESSFAKSYLTDEYAELLYELKRGEMKEFHRKITDREYQWYL